ncbi:hypothetical protein GE09DRAFT_1222473 [Coniochaeta sp. 2T2.1]|nr:hypothetical protein GE09DRAFT_1222473 [Coniochaeta sp. 2T2.1]
MASRKSHRQRAHPASQSEPESDAQALPRPEKIIRRRASVYDAVAGRVTSHLIKTNPSSSTRDPAFNLPLAPDEVLFRRKNAPVRYAEQDIYFVGTDSLSPSQKLPDSDLLKAVHGYAAGYYEAVALELERRGKSARVGGRLVDERSMDETALLAFGILLEEAAREALGKNGDLVFTEGVEDGAKTAEDALVKGKEKGKGNGKGRGPVRAEGGVEDGQGTPGRPAKKRKTSRGATAG